MFEITLSPRGRYVGETLWTPRKFGSQEEEVHKLLVGNEGQVIARIVDEREILEGFSSGRLTRDLKLTQAPRFLANEYYVLKSVRVDRPTHPAHSGGYDQLVQPVTSDYEPPEGTVTFETRPGAENVWKIELPEFVCARSSTAGRKKSFRPRFPDKLGTAA